MYLIKDNNKMTCYQYHVTYLVNGICFALQYIKEVLRTTFPFTFETLTIPLSKSHPTLCSTGYGGDILFHRRTRLSLHDSLFSSFVISQYKSHEWLWSQRILLPIQIACSILLFCACRFYIFHRDH